MIGNVTGVPRVPVYLYALVPDSMEIPWLRTLHVCLQTSFGLNIAHAAAQMDMFTFSFTNSVRFYMHILSHAVEKGSSLDLVYTKLHDGQGRVAIPKCIVESYKDLDQLVKLFNRIFRWPYALAKTLSIIYISFIIYSGIRKRPESPTYVMAVFFTGFIMTLFHESVLMYTMGRMHAASVNLLHAVKEKICLAPRYEKVLWRMVDTLRPMSIQCGKMYGVTPTTVLTYFSVLASYVVVVIQVRGK